MAKLTMTKPYLLRYCSYYTSVVPVFNVDLYSDRPMGDNTADRRVDHTGNIARILYRLLLRQSTQQKQTFEL